ncbi:MAG: hypothetical protein K2N33_00215 [Clostridia bacterium]|nr:hypothetical protein [Clostridia bacterium]
MREDIGTPQNHRFKVTLNVFSRTFTGEGDNVKCAEQLAAQAALNYYDDSLKK